MVSTYEIALSSQVVLASRRGPFWEWSCPAIQPAVCSGTSNEFLWNDLQRLPVHPRLVTMPPLPQSSCVAFQLPNSFIKRQNCPYVRQEGMYPIASTAALSLNFGTRKMRGKPHALTALARGRETRRGPESMWTLSKRKRNSCSWCSWWGSKTGRAVFISVYDYDYDYDYYYVTNDSEFIAPKYM
jgi:hypothetical protein